MKILLPSFPHLARESLELLGCKNPNVWPKIDMKNIVSDIKLAIQVNGKTRDILTIPENTSEQKVNKIVLDSSKAKIYC